MIGGLPEVLTVDGVDYPIRSDYRNILQTFEAFADTELNQGEKWIVAIYLLFEDFNCADDVFIAIDNGFDIYMASEQIIWFISAGNEPGEKRELPTYDWFKDEQMIFSAINKIAGEETRRADYIHWWTFLGYFNEIGEGNFSFVIGIRNKLNKGKKLDKHEREFYNNNKKMVRLEAPKSKEELEEEAERQAILDEVLG